MAEKYIYKEQQQLILERYKAMILSHIAVEKNLVPCLEDSFLLKFLYARDFDSKMSLQLLLNYYKLKRDYAHLYGNFSFFAPNVMEIWKENIASLLPERDNYNRRIIAANIGKWNPSNTSFNDLFIATNMSVEAIIEDDPDVRIYGMTMITNFRGLGLQHLKELTPYNAKKMITLVEESMPVWFHAFHCVNENKFFNLVYTLLKPLLSSSMRQRIFFHGENIASLQEHINPNILPVEYGGSQPPQNSKESFEKLCQYDEYLKKISSFGYKSKP